MGIDNPAQDSANQTQIHNYRETLWGSLHEDLQNLSLSLRYVAAPMVPHGSGASQTGLHSDTP